MKRALSSWKAQTQGKQEPAPSWAKARRSARSESLIEDLADVQTTVLVTGESGTGKELVVEICTAAASGGTGPWSRSTAPPCRKTCSKASCSATWSARSPVRSKTGRPFSARRRRHPVSGRNRRNLPAHAAAPAARARNHGVRAGRRLHPDPGGRAGGGGHQPGPAGEVAGGKFREDLYYRLKVVEIQLPPLRERRDDIPLLVEHFLAVFNRKFGKKIKGVSTDVWTMFQNHHWPGNVRELENTLEHAFVRCHEAASSPWIHLPAEFRELHRAVPTGSPPVQRSTRRPKPSAGPCAKPAGTSPGPPGCWASAAAPSTARCKNTALRCREGWVRTAAMPSYASAPIGSIAGESGAHHSAAPASRARRPIRCNL